MVIDPPTAAGGIIQIANPGALAASLIVSVKPARLLRVSFTNTNAAARWLQLFNAIAVPADTAVPLLSIPVAIGAFVNIDLGVYGRFFSTGIVLCNSSTAATKTIGAADSFFDASYTT
jgi:hypothetical protein